MVKTKGAKDKKQRKRRKSTEGEKAARKQKTDQGHAQGMRSLTSIFGTSSTRKEPANDNAIDTEEPPHDTDDTDDNANAEDDTATNPPDDVDVIDFTENVTFCSNA